MTRARDKASGDNFKSTGIDDNATSNVVTIASDGSLTTTGDITGSNSSGHRSLTIKGNSLTNYQGGSILLANDAMADSYGGTYLYHHKAGGTGDSNGAFNISQRKADGTYISNIYNVDYQNNVQSWYVPGGGMSGGVAMAINNEGQVTKQYQSAFKATGSANQPNLTSNTKIDFDTTGSNAYLYNIGNDYSTTNQRYTAPVDGRYLFHCVFLVYPDDETTYSTLNLYVNGGSNYGYGFARTGGMGHQTSKSLTAILDLNANDYVEAWIQPSATTDVYITGSHGQFIGYLLG